MNKHDYRFYLRLGLSVPGIIVMYALYPLLAIFPPFVFFWIASVFNYGRLQVMRLISSSPEKREAYKVEIGWIYRDIKEVATAPITLARAFVYETEVD